MTEPTQAQIDAAAKVLNVSYENMAYSRKIAKAALTAAAQAGEQYVPKDDPRLDEVIGGPKKKRMGFAGAIDDMVAKEVAATIERCAQRALAYMRSHQSFTHNELVADLRALTTEGK